MKKSTSNFLTISNSQFPQQYFSIHHYAGRVDYSAMGFLVKNQDSAVLNYDAVELFKHKSSNLFVKKQLLPFMIHDEDQNTLNDIASPMRRSKSSNINKMSVSAQFRVQLRSLRFKIESTSPHYVRCLKPNDDLVPDNFAPKLIAHQLQCAGVLEAVRVSRLGYPQRYSHVAFYNRYKLFCSNPNFQDIESNCEQITSFLVDKLSKHILLCEPDQPSSPSSKQSLSASMFIQMGRTKVFLRQAAFDFIEEWRLEKVQDSAILLQAFVRRCIYSNRFRKILLSTVILQSAFRMVLATRKVRHRRNMIAAIILQTKIRVFIARKEYFTVRYVVAWAQRVYRGKLDRKFYRKLVASVKVVVIQKNWRMFTAKLKSAYVFDNVLRIQVRGLLIKLSSYFWFTNLSQY